MENSSVLYFYGLLHMDTPVLADQQKFNIFRIYLEKKDWKWTLIFVYVWVSVCVIFRELSTVYHKLYIYIYIYIVFDIYK